jgi:hypothetical protein
MQETTKQISVRNRFFFKYIFLNPRSHQLAGAVAAPLSSDSAQNEGTSHLAMPHDLKNISEEAHVTTPSPQGTEVWHPGM